MDNDDLPPRQNRTGVAKIDQYPPRHGTGQIHLLPPLPRAPPNLARPGPVATSTRRCQQCVTRVRCLQGPCDFDGKALHTGKRLDGETAIDEQPHRLMRPASINPADGTMRRRGIASRCARAVAATSAANNR